MEAPATQEPIWVPPRDDDKLLQSVTKEFNIHPITAQMLISRGFTSHEQIHNYLYAKLPQLYDPEIFDEMESAVQRIHRAFENNEKILIYGDNDVDGMSATTLLVDFFRRLGASVVYYLPDRSSQFQGMLLDCLDYVEKENVKLIITVDCGVTATEEIGTVVRKGIDVIVTDHHEPTKTLPKCTAILNPKLEATLYPNREITGVGVAFKLAHAYLNSLINRGDISSKRVNLKSYLDLVALGTVADMGSLLGENRILVRYGLRQIGMSKRVGLLKLISIAEVRSRDITPIDIASKIAPRLNSLGRIADPKLGVELLLVRDPIEAERLASELDLNNIERQKIEKRDSDDIERLIKKKPELTQNKAIILASKKWHPGIIPIITARIAKQYNRPTILISIDNGQGKGSIRTIPEFPLLRHLHEQKDLLLNFGGHDFAAGLTIKEENIEAFTKGFISAANATLLEKDIAPKLYLDAAASFKDITFDLMDSFSLLEPFGTDNPAPILYAKAKQAWPPKIVGKTHLKLYLEQEGRALEGIGFNMAPLRKELCRKNINLEIAYTPHVNTFLSKSSIQLIVKAFKVCD